MGPGSLKLCGRALGASAVAATSFWGTSVLWHAIRGDEFGSTVLDVAGVSVAATVACLASCRALSRARWLGPTALASAALAGLWLLGPLFYFPLETLCDWPLLCLLPILTFIMSTYDGTLLGLLLASLGVLLLPMRRSRTV